MITKRSFLRRIRAIWPGLPALEKILVVDLPEDESSQVLSYPRLVTQASDQFDAPLTSAETHSILHYTSGSTGKPKGVQHVHVWFDLLQQEGINIWYTVPTAYAC